DGDLAAFELLCVRDSLADVEAVGHGRRVGCDQKIARAFEARALRRRAAAADELDFSRQEHLKRLAAALEQEKIDVQAVALEGADFFGHVERLDAAADARQAEQQTLLALRRRRGRTHPQANEQR